MKIGIVGASLVDYKLPRNIEYIAADGGLATCLKQGITPKQIIGDFDSLEDQTLLEKFDRITLPRVKDDTDLAKAVEYAFENGYNEIDLFGVTHGRIDHFMAILCLLKKYKANSLHIYDKQNKIYMIDPGTSYIKKDNYQYISFFALKPTTLTIKDCFYTLDSYMLDIDDPLCVSNEILKEEAIVETSEKLLVIQSNNSEVR